LVKTCPRGCYRASDPTIRRYFTPLSLLVKNGLAA
jgi:hypothetical protein